MLDVLSRMSPEHFKEQSCHISSNWKHRICEVCETFLILYAINIAIMKNFENYLPVYRFFTIHLIIEMC